MNKLSVTMSRREKIAGWIYYPLQLLVIPVLLSLLNILSGYLVSESTLNVVYFGINFLFVGLIFFRFLKENGKIALKSPMRCLSSAIFGMVLYWGLSYAVQILIAVVNPNFFNVNDAAIGSMAQENYSLMVIGTVFLVPLAEETLYRGLMFGQLYNRSPLAAYVVSVSVFAAVHVVGYIGQYAPLQLCLCFLQYLPAGIAMGFAYARANSIWSPILMHITFNLIGMAFMR